MEVSAALANDDVAGFNNNTVMAFDTKTFGFTVTAVTRAAYTFFMSEQLQIKIEHFVHLLTLCAECDVFAVLTHNFL